MRRTLRDHRLPDPAPGDAAPAGDAGLTRTRGLRIAVVQLAVTAALLGAVELIVVLEGPLTPTWVSLMIPLTAATYLGAGVVAWLRRRSSDIGALLMAGGVVWLVTGFSNSESPALFALGAVTATVPLAVIVHLLVAFPSGRLTSRGSLALVVAAYLTTLVLEMPLYLFSAIPPPYDVLQVADRPDLVRAGTWVQRGVGITLMAITAALLARRLRVAPPTERRVLTPLYVHGMVSVLFIPLSASVVAPALGWSPVTRYVVQLAVAALIPVAFGWSMLRGGFARTAEVEELGAWLGVDERRRPALRRALAGTLGDPSIDLVFWARDQGRYVDAQGHAVADPVPGGGRAVSEVELGGTRVGAITYNPTAVDDPELVRTAGRVVAIAIDRERLTAELLANQHALRRSRQRIVEAGDRERHRLERNLHDGAQQRLVTIAMQLRLAEAQMDGREPAVGRLVSGAADDLAVAMAELRELARGLHPPLLSEVGLGGALESLAERSQVPVQLSLRLAHGLPEATEVGAYYVVAESMTNAARHSGATSLAVRAEVRAGLLHVEVADDGVGGALPARGSGLEGLVDRVESLGGRLRIVSPEGAGTRVLAELPCG